MCVGGGERQGALSHCTHVRPWIRELEKGLPGLTVTTPVLHTVPRRGCRGLGDSAQPGSRPSLSLPSHVQGMLRCGVPSSTWCVSLCTLSCCISLPFWASELSAIKRRLEKQGREGIASSLNPSDPSWWPWGSCLSPTSLEYGPQDCVPRA